MPGRSLCVLALLAASASLTLAEIPPQIAEDRTPELLDAADFILTLPVERTAKDAEILFALRGAGGNRLKVLSVTGDSVELAGVEGGAARSCRRLAAAST
jgi:hypothetical protein